MCQAVCVEAQLELHTLVDLEQSLHVLPHFLHLSFETFKLTIRVCGTQLLALRVAEEVTIAIRGVRYGENLPLVLVVLTQDRTLNGIYLSAAYFPKFQPCMCGSTSGSILHVPESQVTHTDKSDIILHYRYTHQ